MREYYEGRMKLVCPSYGRRKGTRSHQNGSVDSGWGGSMGKDNSGSIIPGTGDIRLQKNRGLDTREEWKTTRKAITQSIRGQEGRERGGEREGRREGGPVRGLIGKSSTAGEKSQPYVYMHKPQLHVHMYKSQLYVYMNMTKSQHVHVYMYKLQSVIIIYHCVH